MTEHEKLPGPVFLEYLEKAASDVGARTERLDEEFGYLVRLHRNGRFLNICGEALSLNSASASRIVRDKWYTLKILRRAGIPVPEGEIFFRGGYYRTMDFSRLRGKKDAPGYAAKLGYPVVVKPNSMSHGREVRLVRNAAGLDEAIQAVFNVDHIVMIQKPVPGDDVRVILLDGTLLLAYRRKILKITGNGIATVRELIASFHGAEKEKGNRKIDPRDHEIETALAAQGLDLMSIPGNGETVVIRSFNLNLATGTDAEDITAATGPGLLPLCREICRELNLHYAGIDLKCGGPDLPEAVVLEVNGSPSLKHWYLSGHQEQVVEIYRLLIERMFQPCDRNTSGRGKA